MIANKINPRLLRRRIEDIRVVANSTKSFLQWEQPLQAEIAINTLALFSMQRVAQVPFCSS